jgi:hypothetical protein
MFALLLAAGIATASPCPSDLLVADPRLKVVRAHDPAFDNYVVTVDVKNRGAANQPDGTRQHLELAQEGRVLGSQTLPPLGAGESYAAAFRVQLPHQAPRPPFKVELRYVLDSKNASRANCTSANDRVTATL